MSEQEAMARELAQRRWVRDRRIANRPHERDPLALGGRGEWNERDSLCQAYIREARADIENDAVTDFRRTEDE